MTAKHLILRTQLALLAALFCFNSAASAAEAKPKNGQQTAKSDKASAATKEDIVARVNGRPIYATELQRMKKAFLSSQPNRTLSTAQEKEFNEQALKQLTSAELLYQAGQKLKVKDLDKQVEDKISQGKKRFPTEQDFQKQLKTIGITENDLREYTRKDLIISNFVQQNFESKISVSDEESKKFYDQNIDKFKQSESVRASHILIGVDSKASDDDKKKALEKARTVQRALAGGADFAEQAKKFSTCPSSQQGGDLGYFSKGQMVPAFEQTAFAMKPGETSDIVETQFGYHIIKVIDKKPASTISYEDVKARISDHLKRQKLNSAIASYLDQARKTAKIEVLLK